ncbi:MAG TPA: hypothetical protein VLT59_06895 [Steroidobacteraceae bacterium]|nr:hypothetical protein [Steroidobacteraceae bacterium]
MHPIIDTLQRTPIRPDEKLVRSVMASVFNVDLVDDVPVKAQHAIIVLAYKLLVDMGHDPDHVVHILRFFREAIEQWQPIDRAILNLSDNRYAMFFTYEREFDEFKVLDYREGEVLATAPEPLFQASVNLRALAELLSTAMGPPGRYQSGVEEP